MEEDMLDPMNCLYHPASTKDFITSIRLGNGFEHHPHNSLQLAPANSDYSQAPETGLRRHRPAIRGT